VAGSADRAVGGGEPETSTLKKMDHHLIPQFYLRGFRDAALPERQGPQVWVAYLAHKSIGLRSPRGLAQRKDYYAVRPDNGAADHRVETDILQRIDSVTASVFAEIQARDYVLDPDRRGCLALFMALLVTRLPTWRSAVEGFAGNVAAAMMEIAANHPEYFERVLRKRGILTDANAAEIEEVRRSFLERGGYSYRGTPEMSLAQMLGVAHGLSEVLVKMSWVFSQAPPGARFLTSDNPIHWNDDRASPPWNAGLGRRGTVLSFPMNPTLCLMASWHRELPPSRQAPPNVVQALNRRTVQFAEQHVYAATKDGAEAAIALRKVLEAEGMSVGPRVPDLRVATESNPLGSSE
jgi:hypothetical protein